MSDEDRGPSPPPPPEIRRTIRLTSGQLILLPLLLAVVALALAGAFGESSSETRATSGSLDFRLRCPSRLRYRQSQSLVLEVRNLGGTRLDAIRVALDADYLSHFAAVHVRSSEQQAATVLLAPLDPGDARSVTVELAGEDYWRHRGTFEVSSGRDTARLECSTFVFP
jgi:hypothetical protein